MTPIRAVPSIALAAVLGAGSALADDVGEHWQQWRARGPTSYEYGYQKYCECHRDQPPETVVAVADGVIKDVHHLHADSPREVPARAGSLDLYWTIDDLFTLLASATESGATVRAAYDPALGYPTSIYVDYDRAAVGDELELRITRLTPAVAP